MKAPISYDTPATGFYLSSKINATDCTKESVQVAAGVNSLQDRCENKSASIDVQSSFYTDDELQPNPPRFAAKLAAVAVNDRDLHGHRDRGRFHLDRISP